MEPYVFEANNLCMGTDSKSHEGEQPSTIVMEEATKTKLAYEDSNEGGKEEEEQLMKVVAKEGKDKGLTHEDHYT